ncbi:hypothetical protein ACWF0M_29090 [Kribbella sp. NPDC055110]
MCGPTDLTCHVGEGVEHVLNNTFGKLVGWIGDSAMEAMNAVATFWVKPKTLPVSIGADTEHPKNTEVVDFLQGNLHEVTAAVFTLAILIAAIRTVWEQRGEPLKSLLKAMLTFVTVSAGGTATLQLLISYSDSLAVWIIHQVHPDQSSLGTALGAMILQGMAGNNGMMIMLMFAGIIVLLAGLVQVVLMVVRTALLILLAGTFPLAAAATNTEIGKTWFRKYCGWSLAFIAYKPAAALIYATAMKMNEEGVNSGGNLFVKTATGLMMLLMAIFALPALLRFMVPLTAAVAGGSSGMGAASADPGGLATGAVNVGRSGGFRGSTSGGGASGAGASGAGASGAGASGAGASGAAAAGPVGIGVAAAGAMVNGARKAAGGVAGAAAHSAGEAAGGSPTPTTSFRRTSGGASGSRSGPSKSRPSSGPGSAQQERVSEHAGPSGNW